MQEQTIAAPGRVNLIGEHIDYHRLAVLPMALERRVQLTFRRRDDRRIIVRSERFGAREFEWIAGLTPVARGDWENYLRAAAQAVAGKWGVLGGIEATVTSDLPAAAGLSSSSALLVAVTLALLRANGIEASFEELMEILPDGEQFVGTRGGGMDHAVSLAGKAGHATLIQFAPLKVFQVPIPEGWRFVVAHSLQVAEKSGAAREEYNLRRRAGEVALTKLGLPSYHEAMNMAPSLAARLDPGPERDSFLHITSEAARVGDAVQAMEFDDSAAFGKLLLESHASLRERLRVSTPALDSLVAAAMESGALGARLTGAGFGGCVVAFCRAGELAGLRRGLIDRYYSSHSEFHEQTHLIDAVAGAGALESGE